MLDLLKVKVSFFSFFCCFRFSNSSQVSDGACSLIVCTESKAKELNLEPIEVELEPLKVELEPLAKWETLPEWETGIEWEVEPIEWETPEWELD